MLGRLPVAVRREARLPTARHGMAWHGMAWHGMASHGIAWHRVAWWLLPAAKGACYAVLRYARLPARR